MSTSMAGAMAQSPGPLSGLYAGVSAGGSYVFDQSFETDVLQGFVVLEDAGDVDVSYDTGYTIAGHVGYKIDTNIRIEGQLSYSTASGERTFSFDDVEDQTDQDLEILNGALGVFFDLWPVGTFVPYVGGGVGYAKVTVDNDDFGEADQNVFMAFGEAGIPYNLSPSLAIAPSLRFNWYNTDEEEADDIALPVIGANLYNLDFRLGAVYNF
jgi:opacity protein-like surface antigen